MGAHQNAEIDPLGVLGAAGIAVRKVIPAMQQGESCEVVAIASRELAKARAAAQQLGIPRAYGSYEELLADPNIDAIFRSAKSGHWETPGV